MKARAKSVVKQIVGEVIQELSMHGRDWAGYELCLQTMQVPSIGHFKSSLHFSPCHGPRTSLSTPIKGPFSVGLGQSRALAGGVRGEEREGKGCLFSQQLSR